MDTIGDIMANAGRPQGDGFRALAKELQRSSQVYVSKPVCGFEERGTEEQIAALYLDLGMAKVGFGPIAKDAEVKVSLKGGGGYGFKYAPMETLLAATGKPLADRGIVVLLPFTRDLESGKCVQWAIIAHKLGGRLVFAFPFEPKSDVKEFGGQTTYYQRYAYRSALALAADGDLDEMAEDSRGESGVQRQQSYQHRPQSQPQQRSAPQTQQRPQSERPGPAEGARHAQLVTDAAAALRSLGLRTRADGTQFVIGALKREPFPLGDPFLTALTVAELETVLREAVSARAAGESR